MNKRADFGAAIWFMTVLVFIILVWVYLVAPAVSAPVANMITTNNITGLQAFFWHNLSLFFFISLFLFALGYMAILRQQTRRYPGQ